MEMDEKERRDYNEEPTSTADRATTLMVIGALFWISDLFAFLTVGFYDIRVGHTLVLTWVVLAAIAGFVLMLIGWMMKRRAHAEHHHD